MLTEWLLTFHYFMWYLLIAVAILFFVSGLDDLFYDVYYWIRSLYRVWKTRKYQPLTYEKLAAVAEQHIAVLTPCWNEADVIEKMLRHNVYGLDYQQYTLFVGVYPNDPETVLAVQAAAADNSHIHCVLGDQPGPTNKAHNLNTIYQHVKQHEQQTGIRYEIFVLHDSEDSIHPLSFKLYNYLLPRKNMIQIPVFPSEVSLWSFTHWIYADEFSEIHTKDIIVRESIHGLVPSAGVGTAFSRATMDMLIETNDGVPFAGLTLTEDYSTALQICVKNLKQIFVTQLIMREQWRKRWHYFGKPVLKKVKEFVATRSLFPTTYMKAVRQKARWITGISIQEWFHIGWSGGFWVRYTLLHDRKVIFTHLINVLGYIVFLFWVVYSLAIYHYPQYPSLQERLNQDHWVWYLIIACTVIMAERMVQKIIAVWRVYGAAPALLSIPRTVYANVLNMHALLRAYYGYLFHPKAKGGRRWDKTEHEFPFGYALTPKRKLGELLMEEQLLTADQLNYALNKQMQDGQQLGKVLIEQGYLEQAELTQFLAQQYELPIQAKTEMTVLSAKQLPEISTKNYALLLKNYSYPIAVNRKHHQVTVAIEDPANHLLVTTVIHALYPYQVKFALSV